MLLPLPKRSFLYLSHFRVMRIRLFCQSVIFYFISMSSFQCFLLSLMYLSITRMLLFCSMSSFVHLSLKLFSCKHPWSFYLCSEHFLNVFLVFGLASTAYVMTHMLNYTVTFASLYVWVWKSAGNLPSLVTFFPRYLKEIESRCSLPSDSEISTRLSE